MKKDLGQGKGHQWPREPQEHVWGKWMAKTAREGAKKPTQYRQCVHPECNAVETRETPNA